MWLLRPGGSEWQEPHRTGGGETLSLQDARTISPALGPRTKAVTSQELGPDLPAGLGGSHGEVGSSYGSPWGNKSCGGHNRECSSAC